MSRDRYIDTPPRLLAVDLSRQLLPGTFEHVLNHLLDRAVDVSHFDAWFRNDETGAPAYPPALLLSVVLFAYARGMVSGRQIARAGKEQVTFIALCGDRALHVTAIATIVSTLGDQIARVFAAVLAVYDAHDLIGRAVSAIDGMKLLSNASKQRSGTHADFVRQAAKVQAAATMLRRHHAAESAPTEPDRDTKATQRVPRLERDVAQIRTWLANNPGDRRGPKGARDDGTRTVNESAKLATSRGVLQGYTGVAAVDRAHQIVVEPQAHGTSAEQELLVPIVQATDAHCTADTLITHHALRRRDARFATQARHLALPTPWHCKLPKPTSTACLAPRDFVYDPVARTCVCPAATSLYRRGQARVTKGNVGEHFRGAKRDCMPCDRRPECLRSSATTPVRNVALLQARSPVACETPAARMQAQLDTPHGRAQDGRRFATAEPVFANLRHNKRLDRFTLRGRTKVDGQWKIYCLVHNIEKLVHAGYAA